MTLLTRRALLVQMVVHQWYGRKIESSVREEVRISKGAKESEDQYTKVLISKTYLAAVTKAVTALRTKHLEMTLPWQSTGVRILPSSEYFDYCSKMQLLRTTFDAAVREFAVVYPHLVNRLRFTRGALYNNEDYPPAEVVAACFRVETNVLPFPSTEDFRLEGIDTGELRKRIDAGISESVSGALGALADRFSTALGCYATTLSDPEAIFRNSLVERLSDLVELSRTFWDYANEDLTALIECADTLAVITPDTLRHDLAARRVAADLASRVVGIVESEAA